MRILAIFLNKVIGHKRVKNTVLTEREKYNNRFVYTGYLKEIGWWNSYDASSPLDKNNQPIPWITYSAIEFLKERLSANMDIFEFGSGNSTKFYSKIVRSVTSVEHNKKWYDYLKDGLPDNVQLLFRDIDGGSYKNHLKESDKKYDIIIVDGRERVECMKNCINALKPNGVIILDDSQRDKYSEGEKFILETGFKKLDFWGIAPAYFRNKSTTIYYKENNCLDL